MGIIGVLEDLAHFTFGLLSSLSVLVSPTLTVISFLIFILYELDQDFRLQDYMYQEICQFGFGFGLGMLILIILRISLLP